MTEQPSSTPREALDRIVLDAFDSNDECRYCEAVYGEEEHQDWCPAPIAEAALADSATGPLPDESALADAIGPEDLEYWADSIRHDADPDAVRRRLARKLLERLPSATGPPDVDLLAEAIGSADWPDNEGAAISFGGATINNAAKIIAARYNRLASQSSGASDE